MSALASVRRRRSQAKVTEEAPSTRQLLELVAAAGTVADHGSMRPWRLIELRGDARQRLGDAMAAALPDAPESVRSRTAAKPLRAPLLIAIVASVTPTLKVAGWEQEAVAAGVGHLLSLLLDEAGWGVMWRTGQLTRTEPVRVMHGLAPHEELLGWLYVGGKPRGAPHRPKRSIDPREHLSAL
ncbi:nitroreductase family protein [soil metagenome]